MSLRILIGHSLPGQRGTATPLYIGPNGSALDAARTAAGPAIGSFTILNNPAGLRKSNPAYQAASPVVTESTDAKAKTKKK